MAATTALRLFGVTAVGALGTLTVGGATQYRSDEGFRRSLQFWTQAMPAYVHYRAVEFSLRNKSPQEQADAYHRLHEIYSPKMERLVYDLRGFYLKLVQVGSTRDEFLPPEYMRWAKKTQDDVPTELSSDQIREVIEKSIGKRFEDVFQSFEDEPLGAASIGQVHRAVLHNGRAVAVKVQYPRIEDRFRADIATSKRFAKLAQPQYLPFMEEVERQFQTEFDYRGEAENLREIRDNILPVFGSKVVIPEPVLDLCTKNVLVMDFIPGTRLVDGIKDQYRKLAKRVGKSLEELEEQQKLEASKRRPHSSSSITLRRADWAVRLLNLYFLLHDHVVNSIRWLLNATIGVLSGGKYHWTYDERIVMINLAKVLNLLLDVHGYQILLSGCFNADPHPGNVLLCPDGRLGLIDYGQVKRLGLDSRLTYAELMDALYRDDRGKIIEIFGQRMGFVSEKMDPDCLYRRACFFHDRDTDDITGGKNIQLFMEEMNRLDPVVEQSGEFILVGRVSFLMRGMGNAFNLMLRVSDHWVPFARQLLAQQEELEEALRGYESY